MAASAVWNIFQLDLLERASRLARFFAAHDERDRIRATVLLVGEGRLAVPEGSPEGVQRIAQDLVEHFEVQRVIGPEAAATTLYESLDIEVPRLDRIHQLMQAVHPPELRPGSERLELAQASDLEELLQLAAAMHLEELGIDPREEDPDAFERNVSSRIRKGRTFVIRAGRGVVFKADIGSDCQHGAQIEGVYTRPAWRGRGLASAGLVPMVRSLLERRPRVTLHVHSKNLSALRAYQNAGFELAGSLRLISAD